MHSILAIIGIWFATGWIGQLSWQPTWWSQAIPYGAAIATAAFLAFVIKVLKVEEGTWPRSWIIGAAAAAAIALFMPDQIGWFQLCVTVGFLTHIIGDFLTIEGINWFWPLKIKAPKIIANTPIVNLIWKENGYFALPILGKTGSIIEYLFGAALGLYRAARGSTNVFGVAL